MSSNWDIKAATAAAAVFDLDGTVTRGDTYVAFLTHLLRRRSARAVRLPMLMVQAARFKLGLIGNDQLKASFLRGIAGGLGREELEACLPPFLSHQVAQIKTTARQRIDWHRACGHHLVLASASLDIYAVPLGKLLGFDQVLATQVAWHEGRISGALAGPNLRGAAKVTALQNAGIPTPDYAYTDHHSDLPLLRTARFPVAVDPTAKLLTQIGSSIPVERWT